MSTPFNLDAKSVLVDKLGENSERFQISNLFFKNARGLNALFEIRKLKAELLDFAKDPNLQADQLGPVKPKKPNTANLSAEEVAQEEEDYRDLMKQYEMAQIALKMQVPIPDMFAIEQYMEPFEATIHATPAVKGRRFHAFTKEPTEQQSGFFGIGKKSSQAVQ